MAERLREVADDLHVGHLMLLMQFGNMRKEVVRYNTELFARAVKPQIEGQFDDRWEDHWWPKPMARPEPDSRRSVHLHWAAICRRMAT